MITKRITVERNDAPLIVKIGRRAVTLKLMPDEIELDLKAAEELVRVLRIALAPERSSELRMGRRVSYHKSKCRYCEQKISAAGFARASHLRAHVRKLGLVPGQFKRSPYSLIDLERMLQQARSEGKI
jgi:hypothetical protein